MSWATKGYASYHHASYRFPKDSASYKGQWSDDMRSGTGQYESPSGFIRTYNGDWAKDTMSGKGILLFAGNATYEGGMQDDLVCFSFNLFNLLTFSRMAKERSPSILARQ